MIRINNIKLSIDYKEPDIRKKICAALRVSDIQSWKLVRRSIDCRDKQKLHYVISVDVSLKNPNQEQRVLQKIHNNNIMLTNIEKYQFPYRFSGTWDCRENLRPVIIGAGPAGYFAALHLAEAGYAPILLERGKDVWQRTRDVDEFWENGVLHPESNVSFGEGGAGTFSDGKLNTGIKDKQGRITQVLECFHRFGASENVLYDAKPHVGTDVLKQVMEHMRQAIQNAGGDIYFSHKLADIQNTGEVYIAASGRAYPLYRLLVQDTSDGGNPVQKTFHTPAVILAIGHSARDTFQMLCDRGFRLEQKPFALGLRIEHKRADIDRERYGEGEAAKLLPAADYKLTYHASNGRSVFSFCMCPGGYVVNASSEAEGTVVNGMSYSGRDSENSNSAIVCSITPEDYPGNDPMDAVYFQKEIEHRFYLAGQGQVPVQLYGDFKQNETSEHLGKVTPCIKGKYTLSNLRECLPDVVSNAIIEGIDAFEKQITGFSREDAVLSGVESRTSSPVRIPRDSEMMSVYPGILPCGEGAGYAGGITSAAVDGIKAAEACAAYINQLF
jgi:hypothetical protein